MYRNDSAGGRNEYFTYVVSQWSPTVERRSRMSAIDYKMKWRNEKTRLGMAKMRDKRKKEKESNDIH